MARAPRLSLSRRHLRLGIQAVNQHISACEANAAGLLAARKAAQAELMAAWDFLSPWERFHGQEMRAARAAQQDVAANEQRIIELRELRDRLQRALDKESSR